MNLRDLRYLIAVAEHRHFGRAAAASFVSQPTLSTQLRKLEDELGVSLIERAPRKVMLTPIGAEIVERARRVVGEIEQMKEAARRSQRPEAGSVRLGIFPTLGPYLLPHVVPGLRERFPDLQLLLVEEKSDELLARLRDGRLDAAILALPVHDDQLHHEFLFEEPFVLAVPEQHRLAGRRALGVDELASENLLLLEDGHCLRQQTLEVCQLAGAHERTEFRATSLETLRQMVAANVGITLLPALAVQPPVAHPRGIRLLDFSDSRPSRRIALFWRRSSAMSGFLGQLADALRGLSPDLLRVPPAPPGQPDHAPPPDTL